MSDLDHLAQIADMRRKKIIELEHRLDAWREVAGQLHAAVEAFKPGPFPGSFDSAIRCAALEAYARLKSSISQPSSLSAQLPYEL
jgi:hypothetical protein